MTTELNDKLVELSRQLGLSDYLAVPMAEVDAENLSKGDLRLALHRLRAPVAVLSEIVQALGTRVDAIAIKVDAIGARVTAIELAHRPDPDNGKQPMAEPQTGKNPS